MTRFLLSLLVASTAFADTQTDIEYAKVGGTSLKLDLHRPQAENPLLIVYVHGGAWRAGSKSDVPIAKLMDRGFAIASVDYRLSTQAVFPAQVHDIKAAIRFLRANAGTFHVNTDRIAIVGSSAGGHLAALVGVSNGNPALEGKVGDHPDQSSDVQGIVSFYGASNLQSILSQSTEFGLTVRIPALKLLLGDVPDKKRDLAKLASPVAHLDKSDPPLLLIHGDADPQMPPAQSQELARDYEALKLPVTLIRLPGSKHGGPEFYDDERTKIVAEFLRKWVRQQ
ncbi:alpha/beta hydrolase [Prosthecobacter sp.]|uniref:alpha/beta hydrolase n=1 Tax=Prosthecobacter sp. TaxID=1965333 RepID=UPI001DCBE640|nr:alpha/beta hydrolase [Prosthecobacter sp.]MCB1278187.1 alpha/beta hydrolase [Prosthecobacter sp.]